MEKAEPLLMVAYLYRPPCSVISLPRLALFKCKFRTLLLKKL
jgi:hypothetical protein